MIRCIKTGCILIDQNQSKQVYGDLHQINGDTYIFNACLDKHGETNWDSGIECNSPAVYTDHYFERRGVIVFSAQDAVYNQALEDYFGKY